MAHLTWSVLWTAFALIAATPNNYGYGDDYGNSVLQPQSPNADVPSGFDCSGKDNGAYGEGCSKDYWLCWDGVATSQECSFDLMFNQENGQCDFASSIFACSGERPTTQAPLDSSTMEPVDFDCSGLEDGDYPFVQKCQVEYVSCVAGAPWKRSCPDELSFDPENRICDRLENIVACGGSPPTAADVVQIDYECPSPSGSFALVSALCSPTYYICEDNKPTIAMCSDEMIWDDAHKECRMASDIPDCSFDCNGKADSPYSIGCSQNYWWCWEGKATKLACPEGMMFNSENGQCDFENNIFECTGQRVSPTSTVASDFATPPPVDFDCSSVEDGNHAFKDGATCQPKFVSCVGGVAWELTCPDGLLFDPDQLLCERVERIVACGGSLEETTTQSYEDLYSYKQTTPRPRRKIHKTTVAVPITRRAYHQKQKMTTTLADLPTELPSDNYADYETTTRRRHHKTTTPAAEPTTRRSYYQTTTLAEEPTTSDDSYGSYETTTLAEPITTTRRSSYGYKRTTTPAAEPTTRRSYYQTTTLADEPTTELRSDYGDYETTTVAEPITTTRRSSYGYKRTTTPAAEPTTRRSYYQTTTLAEPTTTSSYDSYETTTLAEPITTTRRSSYGYKHHKRTTTPAAEPTTRRSYYQTTPAAKPTTKQSYSRPIIRRVSKPVTRRHSYYQTTTPAAEPTTRASYYQKKTTPAAEPTTRRSYYQTTTPAAEPTTRASYYQKKTTTLADEPITRRSYYQTTTPAAEPITTTRRSSYGYKRTTTPAAEPTTRRSYYQTTRLAEPTTRKPYSRPAIRRLLPKPQPIVRQSYHQTTPAAEPVTRNSYNHKRLTTPADVPVVRRTYKLTAEEPTTRKPQFKQSSYY